MKSTNIAEKIQNNNYLASPEQIVELTRQYIQASSRRDNISGTYLNSLAAGVQNVLTAADTRPADVLLRIDEINRVYYGAVMKAILASGVKGPEVRRRNGFARSAKSTLVFFVKHGGDIRKLEAGSITKEKLRQAHRPPTPALSPLRRSANTIVARVRSLAKIDVNEARGELLWVLELVQHELEDLDSMESRQPRITGQRLQRTEHRHHS